MTTAQMKMLLAAVRDALAHECTDQAKSLVALGVQMCDVDAAAQLQTKQLWEKIEDCGQFIAKRDAQVSA